MNTLDNLKSLDLDSIKPVFDELAGEEKDAGRIGKVDFLFSVYFKSNERESCERLAHELTTRGHRVVAMLNHAKLLLIVTTDGASYVVESSANLRSCSSIEQITITADADLLAFHRAWIDELMRAKA